MVNAIESKYPVRNRAWSPLHDEDGFDGEYAAAYVAEASTLDHQLSCPDHPTLGLVVADRTPPLPEAIKPGEEE